MADNCFELKCRKLRLEELAQICMDLANLSAFLRGTIHLTAEQVAAVRKSMEVNRKKLEAFDEHMGSDFESVRATEPGP